MESPTRALSRLVAALETLVEHESVQVAARDHAAVLRTQQKAGLIMEKLIQIGAGPADAATRSRVATLLAKRRRTKLQIEVRISQLRQELARVGGSRNMLASVVPVYSGAKRPASGRLCALT